MAQDLGLDFLDSDRDLQERSSFYLTYLDGVLNLGLSSHKVSAAIAVNFSNPSLRYRVANAVQSQSIAKAVGVKPGLRPDILDATAGLGKDAFLLASLGCQVELIEKSAVVFALLADGVNRAQQSNDGQLLQTIANMKLLKADFMDLPAATLTRDVIYLDPMFPKRNKSAQVKKDMFILQQFLGGDNNSDALLTRALDYARRRVVVKRSKSAGYLAGLTPSFELKGKSSRYDVYVTT